MVGSNLDIKKCLSSEYLNCDNKIYKFCANVLEKKFRYVIIYMI